MIRRLLATLTLFAALLACGNARASQATQVTPSSPLSMSSLATFLNNAFQANATFNSGSSSPTVGPSGAPIANMAWWNTNANPNVFEVYDGANWDPVFSMNTSTHAIGLMAGLTASAPPTQSLLTVNGNANPIPFTSFAGETWIARFATSDGNVPVLALDAFGQLAAFACERTDGTSGSPTGLVANDVICAFTSHGRASDGNYYGGSAQLRLTATETWGASAQGTVSSLWATPNGSAAATGIKQIANFVANSSTAVSETLGVAGSTIGSLCFANATSGSICITPPAGGLGSAVLTPPDVTDTLAVLGTPQTFSAADIFSSTLKFTGLSGGAATKYLCLDASNFVVSSISAC